VTNTIALLAGGFVYLPNYPTFFVMRFFQGLCVGLYSTIIPNYVKEISPNIYKGTFGAFIQVFLAIGTVFAFFLTYVLT
jgi:MFS family permease